MKASVTDLPPDQAAHELIHGCGFVLYTNLYSEAVMKECKSVIARELEIPEIEIESDDHINKLRGYDRIYADAKEGY
jgi:hypothetical protein